MKIADWTQQEANLDETYLLRGYLEGCWSSSMRRSHANQIKLPPKESSHLGIAFLLNTPKAGTLPFRACSIGGIGTHGSFLLLDGADIARVQRGDSDTNTAC